MKSQLDQVTSSIDNGREWYKSTALDTDLLEGEPIERWDTEYWYWWILESNSFSGPQLPLHSIGWFPFEFWWKVRWLDWLTELWLSVVISCLGTAGNILLCVIDFLHISSRPCWDENCWSNVSLYKERRYRSKWITSSSNTAISLISSLVAWKSIKWKYR